MFFMNIKSSNINFGLKLRTIRKEKGYTMDQLAEIAGISKRMISHYETQVKRPSIDKIELLAQALNVSVKELMETKDSPKDKKTESKTFLKIMKKVRVIEKLTEREQRIIFNFINTIIEKHQLKEKYQTKK
jgi:transcriptional regulator with XRE-family HTH domain